MKRVDTMLGHIRKSHERPSGADTKAAAKQSATTATTRADYDYWLLW